MELMQSHTRSTSFCSLAGNADPKQSETRKNLKHVRICMSPPRSGSRCIKRHRPPVENGDRHQAESFNDGLMHKCEKHIMQMPAEKHNGQCSRKHNSPQKKGKRWVGPNFSALQSRRVKAAASLLAAMHKICYEMQQACNYLTKHT